MFAAILAVLLAPLAAAPEAAVAPRPPRARAEILVFAAASLSDALAEIGRAYEAGGGGRVAYNFAASSDLSRQIEAGAPADALVSANRQQIERLARSGRVLAQAIVPLLGNTLVVVAPRGSPARPLAGPHDLLGFDRLSLADPAAVPAGVYARAWLESEGLWRQVAPRVVPALDVRAALAAVAAGDLPAGIVYATDAASSPRVRVIYRVPAAATPDLRYYAAPVAPLADGSGRASSAAPGAAFIAFLRGPRAAAIFARHGFLVLPSPGA